MSEKNIFSRIGGALLRLKKPQPEPSNQPETDNKQLGVPVVKIKAAADASVRPAASPDVLAALLDNQQQLIGSLQTVETESRRQSQAMEEISELLNSDRRQTDETAKAISRLAEAVENFNRSSASHIELIEQIRDRLAGTNDHLERIMTRHARRFTWLAIATFLMLAALAVVIYAHGLMSR